MDLNMYRTGPAYRVHLNGHPEPVQKPELHEFKPPAPAAAAA